MILRYRRVMRLFGVNVYQKKGLRGNVPLLPVTHVPLRGIPYANVTLLTSTNVVRKRNYGTLLKDNTNNNVNLFNFEDELTRVTYGNLYFILRNILRHMTSNIINRRRVGKTCHPLAYRNDGTDEGRNSRRGHNGPYHSLTTRKCATLYNFIPYRALSLLSLRRPNLFCGCGGLPKGIRLRGTPISTGGSILTNGISNYRQIGG